MSQKLQPITIDIEICTGCKSHQWCTRHDQKKYESTFQQVSSAIRSKDGSITVTKHQVNGNKIGAFEISSDGRLLYSKLECGYFPHIKYISDRVIDYANDRRDGKDLEKYDINSAQSKMRKSNEKYYDKLSKSSIVEKSPKKAEPVKVESRTKEVHREVKEHKKEEKKEERKEDKKEEKKETKKEEKKEPKKEEKKEEKKPETKPETKPPTLKSEPKKQQPKQVEKKEPKKQEPKEEIPKAPETNEVKSSQKLIHVAQQLPLKKWTSNISNNQFQTLVS